MFITDSTRFILENLNYNQEIHCIFVFCIPISGMLDVIKLKVSDVVQKAFIEVNEEGSEAAAAMDMVFIQCCADWSDEFTCNKPFLFLIIDKLTGLILFTGRVANPSRN